jgi:hypothetical protein
MSAVVETKAGEVGTTAEVKHRKTRRYASAVAGEVMDSDGSRCFPEVSRENRDPDGNARRNTIKTCRFSVEILSSEVRRVDEASGLTQTQGATRKLAAFSLDKHGVHTLIFAFRPALVLRLFLFISKSVIRFQR